MPKHNQTDSDSPVVFAQLRTYVPPPFLPARASPYFTVVSRRKPPVPRRDERPSQGLRSGKNFVTANAVEAILAVSANHHKVDIDYLGKEDYGRVPVRRENIIIITVKQN